MVRTVADESVSPHQSMEPLPECIAAGHPLAIVNNNARKTPLLLQEISQKLQEFFVAVMLVSACGSALAQWRKIMGFNDRREGTFPSHPLIRRIVRAPGVWSFVLVRL